MEAKAGLKERLVKVCTFLVLAIILIILILGGFFLIWSIVILCAIGASIYGLIKAIMRIFRRKRSKN